MNLILKVRRLLPEAKLPTQGHNNDAAFDVFAVTTTTLKPGERTQVKTGIALDIPKGHSVFIWDKSGLSHKHGLKTLGGVVDEGYKGEVLVGVINLGSESYTIEKDHKIAQMVLQKRENVTIEEVDTLESSSRGERGFGSTGK